MIRAANQSIFVFAAAVFFASKTFGADVNIQQETKGDCSPAVVGDNSVINISCKIIVHEESYVLSAQVTGVRVKSPTFDLIVISKGFELDALEISLDNKAYYSPGNAPFSPQIKTPMYGSFQLFRNRVFKERKATIYLKALLPDGKTLRYDLQLDIAQLMSDQAKQSLFFHGRSGIWQMCKKKLFVSTAFSSFPEGISEIGYSLSESGNIIPWGIRKYTIDDLLAWKARSIEAYLPLPANVDEVFVTISFVDGTKLDAISFGQADVPVISCGPNPADLLRNRPTSLQPQSQRNESVEEFKKRIRKELDASSAGQSTAP